MATLIGREIPTTTPTSQVYQATHRGDDTRLPFMNRSFISFTYGGKHIEDFNLIATIDGNRISRNGYADFNELATTYEVGYGQYYWGSYYKTNSITFKLATDGMDQRQLDNFVWWFGADEVRELILAEHPNRAIMARVKNPPEISLLPFEKKIKVQIGEESYTTSTTNYKGEITLSLVMDEPHWYSKINIFGHQTSEEEGGLYRDDWIDANGIAHSVYDDPDAIKICYEDGIPISSMLQESMLLGDNTFATVQQEASGCIATMTESNQQEGSRTETYVSGAVVGDDDNLQEEYTYEVDVTYVYTENNSVVPITVTEVLPANRVLTMGRIHGPKMNTDTSLITVGPSNPVLYFYYAGTAPAPVKLSFTLQSVTENKYISLPSNTFASNNGKEYNTITLESLNKQELKFTTPGIYTAYNTAVKIFKESDGKDIVEITELLRDYVYHSGVRAWAMRILDSAVAAYPSSNILNKGEEMATFMEYVFWGDDEQIAPASYSFNSKTGEAIGWFKYREIDDTVPSFDINSWKAYRRENLVEHEENIGDMLKSNYLIIRDRNLPVNGVIEHWQDNNRTGSHKFYHDIGQHSISNVRLEYKNMYL